MTPKGADLDATDLIEVSTIVGGSYVTKSITGQELIDAIPLPPTGLTVGTTPISSGTVGRILFEGTGNVVQESSSLFWDATNNRLGIGTSTPAYGLDVVGTARVSGILSTPSGLDLAGWYLYASGTSNATLFGGSSWVFDTVAGGGYRFRTAGNTDRLRIESTGNVLINTTTDAGFRLDVNGTARVQDRMDVAGNNGRLVFRSPELSTRLNGIHWTNPTDTGSYGYIALSGGTGEMRMFASGTYFPTFYSNGSERMRIFTTGNIGINTTTDAGFRLDVNGTARVKGTGTSISTFAFNVENSAGTETFRVYDNGLVRVLGGAIVMNGSNGSFTAGFIGTAGQIGAGTTSVSASAQLEISSTTRGFLPPRMTTTQKNAIASPAAGLMVYDTTLNVISYYNGTMWI